jgi:hypothetical protein
MTQNKFAPCIRKLNLQKRRAGAEVIASLLLVAITVVGAVILTTFLDETFVAGGVAASGSDNTIKSIKLLKYDSRDGDNLLEIPDLNNTSVAFPTNTSLCRSTCSPTTHPMLGGTQFIVIQIVNQSVNPIFLEKIFLDNATHSWDRSTTGNIFVPTGSVIAGEIPGDGMFSIFSTDVDLGETKYMDNQIPSGAEVNLLVKLDASNPDIPLGKTIRTQFNIGDNQLSEFFIDSGGAQ